MDERLEKMDKKMDERLEKMDKKPALKEFIRNIWGYGRRIQGFLQ